MAKLNPKMQALLRGALFGVLLFAGLYANIIGHEFGHFLVAQNLGLQPELHLFENESGTGFSFVDQRHYVSYQSPSVELDEFDFKVALAGPLTNLLAALGLAYAYIKTPKNKKTLRIALIMLIIPSVLSAIMNFIPAPGIDGDAIWGYLRL